MSYSEKLIALCACLREPLHVIISKKSNYGFMTEGFLIKTGRLVVKEVIVYKLYGNDMTNPNLFRIGLFDNV